MREDILSMLLNELALIRLMMLDLLGSPISQRRLNHYYSTQLRAEALLPLHKEQVLLLANWRSLLKKARSKEADQVSAEPASQCECHCQCHGNHRIKNSLS